MQAILPGSGLGRGKLAGLLSSAVLAEHPQRETIEQRIKIVGFFDKHGAKLTKEAFGVSRSTVYGWKKKLKDSRGKLIGLSPLSRAPLRRRKKARRQEVVAYIRDYRNEHPLVGQEAIKAALDRYCRKHDFGTVSVATIGRILRELKGRGAIEDALPNALYDMRRDSVSSG